MQKQLLQAPQHKRAPMGILESAVDASGTFSGYASVFLKPDLSRDIIMPGAFKQSLLERGVGGIRMLWQHDATQPIGIWQDIREDAKGLFVKGKLNLSVLKAREAYALMSDGALNGLSIGFSAQKVRKSPKSSHRQIERVDLWEISIVTFPMLPEARVHALKSCSQGQLLHTIERATQHIKTATQQIQNSGENQ